MHPSKEQLDVMRRLGMFNPRRQTNFVYRIRRGRIRVTPMQVFRQIQTGTLKFGRWLAAMPPRCPEPYPHPPRMQAFWRAFRISNDRGRRRRLPPERQKQIWLHSPLNSLDLPVRHWRKRFCYWRSKNSPRDAVRPTSRSILATAFREYGD